VAEGVCLEKYWVTTLILFVDGGIQAVVSEATRLMDVYSMCLTSVGSREKSGYDYIPTPVNTSKAVLPSDVVRVGEVVAENCHEVWSQGRIDQGWRWGAERDNEKKLHPDLIPYSMLTEETKQYDRDTAFETLKVRRAVCGAVLGGQLLVHMFRLTI